MNECYFAPIELPKKRSSSLPKKGEVNSKSSIREKSLRIPPKAYTGGRVDETILRDAYLYTKIEEQKLKKYLELKRSLNKDDYDHELRMLTADDKLKYTKKRDEANEKLKSDLSKQESSYWKKRYKKYADLNKNEDMKNKNLLSKHYQVLPYSPALLSNEELERTVESHIKKINSTEIGKSAMEKAYDKKDDKMEFWATPGEKVNNEYIPGTNSINIDLNSPTLIKRKIGSDEDLMLMNTYMQIQGKSDDDNKVLVEQGLAGLDNTIFHESGHKLQYSDTDLASHGTYQNYIVKKEGYYEPNSEYSNLMKERAQYWPTLKGHVNINEHDNIANVINELSENLYRRATFAPLRDSYIPLREPFCDTIDGISKDALFFLNKDETRADREKDLKDYIKKLPKVSQLPEKDVTIKPFLPYRNKNAINGDK